MFFPHILKMDVAQTAKNLAEYMASTTLQWNIKNPVADNAANEKMLRNRVNEKGWPVRVASICSI